MTEPTLDLIERIKQLKAARKYYFDAEGDTVDAVLGDCWAALQSSLERERVALDGLKEARAYLAAGAGWSDEELQNPTVAKACGMGCREGLAKINATISLLKKEG